MAKNVSIWPLSTFRTQFLAKLFYLMVYTNFIWDFSKFWIFSLKLRPGTWKNRKIMGKKCVFFSSGDPQKWTKNSKWRRIPNNVCITHKMEQLGQKWDSKSWSQIEIIFQRKERQFLADFLLFFHTFYPKGTGSSQFWHVAVQQPK